MRHRVSSLGESVDTLRVVNVDRVRPAEIFLGVRVGLAQRAGGGRIVRLEEEFVGECPKPRVLFAYTTIRPPIKPPRSTGIANYSLRLGNYAPRFPGLEMRVRELYVGLREPLCCPSRQRTSFFRFSPSKQRFVMYQTKLRSRGR